LKNNAIVIILLLFLAMTSFFWFQSLRIKDLPIEKNTITSTIDGAKAEAFVKHAEELLIDYREPPPALYGRDPFHREKPVEQDEEVAIDLARAFVVSSIMYSELNALAVVNGMILAEGDTIHDKMSGYDFMIESIEVDKVAVINGDKKYTLEKSHEDESLNRK